MTLKVLDKTFDTLEDYLLHLEQEWHRFQTKLYSLEDYLKMGTLFWNVSAIKVAKIKVPLNWEDNISEWDWWYDRVSRLINGPFEFVAAEQALICDGCGRTFQTTLDADDDPMDPEGEAQELGWKIDDDNIFCPDHVYLHPDQRIQRVTYY